MTSFFTQKSVRHQKAIKLFGLGILLLVSLWLFILHIPSLFEGYLNAGDDHVHVAFSNELRHIWGEEGNTLGWSRLYATGAPIFVLRPPGFYFATNIMHYLTSLTIEESHKLIVLLGLCLFPLSIYICGRLLKLGFGASVCAGLLAPLPISLWGHTIDAYQYLGIHKQLLAILLFPPTVGGLWRLLKDGTYGWVFAILFPLVFITHPYIAYCLALLTPCMLVALMASEPDWNWKHGLWMTSLYSIPAFLLLCLWLIPFVSSQEIQVIDPFLSRRKAFDVIVCTTGETLRQWIFGGILDTARFAGPFGGTEWAPGNEWGWINNSRYFRIPILTGLTIIGWAVLLIRPKSSVRSFLALAFLLSFLLLIGPDDFPFLDMIPFASQFQNIHAIFIFEWAALMVAGFAAFWLFEQTVRIPNKRFRYAAFGAVFIIFLTSYGTAVVERTRSGARLIDVRNIYTENGKLVTRSGMHPEWRSFVPVVEGINQSQEAGLISGFPLEHDDSVLYNLLPHMVNRSVFMSGFEEVGGIYKLLLQNFRADLRDNYRMQQLFYVRHVINSPFHRKVKMNWHENVELLYSDKYWELGRIKGDIHEFDQIPLNFVAFIGNEREWADFMEHWLKEYKRAPRTLPWVINLVHAGLTDVAIRQIKPYISTLILGNEARPIAELENIPQAALQKNTAETLKSLILKTESNDNVPANVKVIKRSRKEEVFFAEVAEKMQAFLFKRTYYRSWEVTMDDDRIPVYRISPGLQMVLVPQGNHVLRWHYPGPNRWMLASASFWISLIMIGLITWKRNAVSPFFHRTNSENTELEPVKNESMALRPVRKLIPYTSTIICSIFIMIFLFQTYSELYRKIPVIILPSEGQRISKSTAEFHWNYVSRIPKTQQKFKIEVSENKDFSKIICSGSPSQNSYQCSNAFTENQPYYYRLRLEMGDQQYPWTRPRKVYGASQ